MHMKNRSHDLGKKIPALALLTALGLLAFLIESLLPPLFIPGAKLGLSNIFSLLALLFYGLPEALLLVVARTVLGSLFAGNLSLLLYSLTAGVCSVLVARVATFAMPKLSVVCVSILSAVTHNCVQLAVYCALTGTALLLSYSPYLLLFGILSGAIVGLSVFFLIKGIPLSLFERILGEKEEEENSITEVKS